MSSATDDDVRPGDETSGDVRRRVGPGRLLLGALGLAAAVFGAQQLLTGGNSTRITSSVPWLVGVLLVHDAVLAPAAAIVGWGLTRLLRERAPRALPVIAIGLYLAAVLGLVALPALLKNLL